LTALLNNPLYKKNGRGGTGTHGAESFCRNQQSSSSAVHYHVHNNPLRVLIRSHTNAIKTHPISKIHINVILPSTPKSLKWPLSFRFPHQNSVGISLLPQHSTCPAHPVHPNSTHRRSPVTSCHFDPKIFLSLLFADSISLC
jgi:hypothetical protein